MTLNLDQQQRLNLIAMLDALECGGRREAFAVCRLQEKIDLSEAERDSIGWRKMRAQDGREFVLWNNNGSIQPKEYDLAQEDVNRICRAVDQYRVVLGRDRVWWEPLTALLTPPVEGDADKPEESSLNFKQL